MPDKDATLDVLAEVVADFESNPSTPVRIKQRANRVLEEFRASARVICRCIDGLLMRIDELIDPDTRPESPENALVVLKCLEECALRDINAARKTSERHVDMFQSEMIDEGALATAAWRRLTAELERKLTADFEKAKTRAVQGGAGFAGVAGVGCAAEWATGGWLFKGTMTAARAAGVVGGASMSGAAAVFLASIACSVYMSAPLKAKVNATLRNKTAYNDEKKTVTDIRATQAFEAPTILGELFQRVQDDMCIADVRGCDGAERWQMLEAALKRLRIALQKLLVDVSRPLKTDAAR